MRYHPILRPAFLGLLAIGSLGCSTPKYRILEREKALGTDKDLDRRFHRMAHDDNALGIRFPGYLIGLEKTKRTHLGMENKEVLESEPWIEGDFLATLRGRPRGPDLIKSLQNRFDDPERIFVSHVVASTIEQKPVPHLRNRFLYNAYATHEVPGDQGDAEDYPSSAMSDARKSLGIFKEHLQESVPRDDYTHAVVMCMGWNTDQEKAIRNFNSLYLNLLKAAGDNPWKPLFIGFTWPSLWEGEIGTIASFKAKRGDADEAGAHWLNLVINDVLPDIRRKKDGDQKDGERLKVICIGHSLGARAIGRAAFSSGLIKGRTERSNVDALVLLQGAFPINFFLTERDKGEHGAPFAGYATNVGRVVLTWSLHDTANRVAECAFDSNYAGASAGYKRASDPEYKNHFDLLTLNVDGTIQEGDAWRCDLKDWRTMRSDASNCRVVMVNASDVVKEDVWQTGGGAHSDIYTEELARFLWSVVRDV